MSNKLRDIIKNDNTRVVKLPVGLSMEITPEQRKKLELKRIRELEKKNQAYIYDADKAKYYQNLLDIYNYNAFGYGILGNQTRFDPRTPEGQLAISSSFDYAKGNAVDFLSNVSGVGIGAGISKLGNKASQVYSRVTRGVFRAPTKNGALGTLKLYAKNPIGGGAEAIVIKNTPTTVGKMTSIPVEEMVARNSIPRVIKSKYIGYVKDNGIKLPTYVLKAIKIVSDKAFPKYAKKLDKYMYKNGFLRVKDPNVQYRAYTNGKVVADDIGPGNVGTDVFGKPWIVDFNLQTVDDWLALGFRLKNGGKL